MVWIFAVPDILCRGFIFSHGICARSFYVSQQHNSNFELRFIHASFSSRYIIYSYQFVLKLRNWLWLIPESISVRIAGAFVAKLIPKIKFNALACAIYHSIGSEIALRKKRTMIVGWLNVWAWNVCGILRIVICPYVIYVVFVLRQRFSRAYEVASRISEFCIEILGTNAK